jgi:hypothetical protein
MGADIYLRSVYDKQCAEFRVDDMRERLTKLRTMENPPEGIERLIDEGRELFAESLHQAEKGAYFRDSYNSSNLAWLCGLSYWGENGNLDDNGCLRVERAREWLQVLSAVHIPQVVLHAKLNWEENRRREKVAADNNYKSLAYGDLAKPELQIDDEGGEEDFRKTVLYFADKRQALMTLLQRSIDLDEPLIWSV